jgi:ElaB/YqjD/DUF883 family membrane-anchored ribosome-binding protein
MFKFELQQESDMSKLTSIREELEKLKTEIMAKRSAPTETTAAARNVSKVVAGLEAKLERQIGELNKLVKSSLDDAEVTVAEHPVATVAGAMALGIVIGRLSAR